MSEDNLYPLNDPAYTRTIRYIIRPDQDGIPACDLLRSAGYSHRLLARLKRTRNAIRLDGKWIPSGLPVRSGSHLEVSVPYDFHRYEYFNEQDLPTLCGIQLPQIIYQDDDILVLNKPAGMPTHPSHGHHGDTLSEITALMLLEKEPAIQKAAACLQGSDVPGCDPVTSSCMYPELYLPSLRCTGRLDSDTSGLLVAARHALSSGILSDAMKRREIHRTYQAIVYGCIDHKGTVDAPIGREDGSTIRRCIDPLHGDYAVTHYRPLLIREDLNQTLLELELETGRTHQIRVHMTSLGHPLVGDTLYEASDSVKNYVCETSAGSLSGKRKGQLLHSCKLSFVHPLSGEEMEFSAPLPPEMQYICQVPS